MFSLQNPLSSYLDISRGHDGEDACVESALRYLPETEVHDIRHAISAALGHRNASPFPHHARHALDGLTAPIRFEDTQLPGIAALPVATAMS